MKKEEFLEATGGEGSVIITIRGQKRTRIIKNTSSETGVYFTSGEFIPYNMIESAEKTNV